jgi:hypothetical protein
MQVSAHAPHDVTRCTQVLCVEYLKNAETGELQAEYFTERLDHIQDTYYIDPFNLGQV